MYAMALAEANDALLNCIAACCSCCSVVYARAVAQADTAHCWSVLQCAAMCCSVL